MCFTFDKLLSLCVVVAGVVLFGKATEMRERLGSASMSAKQQLYTRIRSCSEVEVEMEEAQESLAKSRVNPSMVFFWGDEE